MKHFTIISLLLLFSIALSAQWHINEGFEGISTLPTGWTVSDDGDGMTWRNYNNANYAHGGNRAALADNYLPNQNADWLITPQISITSGDSLFFYTRSWVSTENLKVYASTTGNLPVHFTTQLANIQSISNSYQEIKISLNQFVGQNIYLGFFWQCSTYGILIDDVKVGKLLVITPELNLPDSISFVEGESLTLDFTQYAVCTSFQTASLSVSPTTPISVQIDGFQVTFSSPEYNGTQELTFILHDGSTGLTATDNIIVTVMPIPPVDLAIEGVFSPRATEYLGMPFTPSITVSNNGLTMFSDQFELGYVCQNAQGNIVSSESAFYTAEIGAGQSMIASFSSPITINTAGSYSFIFSIITTDENMGNNEMPITVNVVLRNTAGGPDGFGYRFIDSNDPLGPTYNWIDISETGTSSVLYNVPTWSGDDNFSEPIPLGFAFPFYGSTYTSAFVDINGEILFSPNNWYSAYPSQGWGNDGNMFNYMYPIPGYTQMPALVAVYWDDLQADEGIGNVYFQTYGESPSRYTVVQWQNLRYHAGTGGSPVLKFQAILHENGEIVMQYHTVATGQIGTIPHNYGASATVAIQNAAANAGLCYLREIVQDNTYIGVEPAGNMLHNNLAIRFFSAEDDQSPIITHKAIGNTFQQNVDLIATIFDMSTITTAELHYSFGEGWNTLTYNSCSDNQFYFDITNIPLGVTVQYYFIAQDSESNAARLPLNAPGDCFSFKVLPSANSQVLIAYSGTQDYQRTELPIYESILSNLHIPYDIYNWEEYPEYSFPTQYRAILSYANTGSAGDKANTLSIALMDYLDSGTVQSPKHLWFSSDGWASSQHGHPNSSPMKKFTSGYMRTSFIASGFGGGTNGLSGPNNYTYETGTILCLPGSPVGTPQTLYGVYANSPDCIFPDSSAPDHYWDEVPYPEIGSAYNFAFEGGPFNGQAYLYHGVCATKIELPVYKAMFFSFDFSQLTSAIARNQWMNDLMSWFGVNPVDAESDILPSLVSGIDRVYPNPFNPTTTISYNVAEPDIVSLAIYNLKGQKVKQLVQDTILAGRHSVIWDGTDSNGNPVSSGLYHLKLETRNTRQTRKLTLIK